MTTTARSTVVKVSDDGTTVYLQAGTFAGGMSAVETVDDIILATSSGGSDSAGSTRPTKIPQGDYTSVPFATLQAAIDAVPHHLYHDVRVNLHAGNLAGGAGNGFYGPGVLSLFSASAAATTTGALTGLAGGGSSATVLDNPLADWPVGGLRGTFLIIDDGAEFPAIRQIYDNTASQAYIDSCTALSGAGVPWHFARWTTNLTSALTFSGNASKIRIWGGAFGATGLDTLLESVNNFAVSAHGLYVSAPGNLSAVYSDNDRAFDLSHCHLLNNAQAQITSEGLAHSRGMLLSDGILDIDASRVRASVYADNCTDTPLTISNARYAHARLYSTDATTTPLVLESVGHFTHDGLSGANPLATYAVEVSGGGQADLSGGSSLSSATAAAYSGIVVEGEFESWTTLASDQAVQVYNTVVLG